MRLHRWCCWLHEWLRALVLDEMRLLMRPQMSSSAFFRGGRASDCKTLANATTLSPHFEFIQTY